MTTMEYKSFVRTVNAFRVLASAAERNGNTAEAFAIRAVTKDIIAWGKRNKPRKGKNKVRTPKTPE